MKLLFQALLLVVMFALQKCQEYADEPEYYSVDTNKAVFDITMYQQMEDREKNRVIVVCMFDRMFEWEYTRWIQPFELSVESELTYTKDKVDCTSVGTRITCMYMVTVSPPASFTCEREVHSNGDYINMRTQTYTYKRSGVSSFCIGLSSSIAVGLFIMTVAVIVI